jgi:hypothetical protein
MVGEQLGFCESRIECEALSSRETVGKKEWRVFGVSWRGKIS